jgi:hypothetical protein
MNLRKGLLRLWVAGSLAFAGFVFWQAAPSVLAEFKEYESQRQFAAQAKIPGTAEEFLTRGDLRPIVTASPWATLAQPFAIAVGVPTAALLSGFVVVWIVAGFGVKPSN